MAMLSYRTHDLDVIAPQVEEVVRKDLGAAMRVPFRVRAGSSAPFSARELGRDIVGLAIGHRPSTVGFIEFDLPWHRAAVLTVTMDRVGVSSISGSLHYAVDLARPLDGAVGFELPKLLRSGRFTGGPAAARLNAEPALAKRLGKVVRAQAAAGTMIVQIAAGFGLKPVDETSSRLIILTLPGGIRSPTTDAGEVLAIARAVEAKL
jgi:hypothetical protein